MTNALAIVLVCAAGAVGVTILIVILRAAAMQADGPRCPDKIDDEDVFSAQEGLR